MTTCILYNFSSITFMSRERETIFFRDTKILRKTYPRALSSLHALEVY